MVADTIAPKRKTKRSPPEKAELPPGTTRFQGLALSNDHPLVKAFSGDDSQEPVANDSAAVPGWSEIGVFSLFLLERHPDNRVPTAPEVAAIADSLQEEGQLEALVIRKLSDMRYQIISGETRWLAAKQLAWPAIRARTIECSDARALHLLAIFNAKRKDLDAIQKARMIQRLCEPEDKNGGGMTREAAGKIYGLESASAASNLIRLLELPEVWQKRVIAGELAQTMAREILPIRQVPGALKVLEDQWKRKQKGEYSYAFDSRDDLENAVDEVLHENVRRLDHKHWYSGADGNGEFDVLIHKDDIQVNRKKLGLTTISVSERGKSIDVEVATNVELFDKLQRAAVEKHLASKRKGKASKAAAADDDEPASKKLSPADLTKRKADKTRQLADRRAAWRHAWLGRLVADRLEQRRDVVALVMCWLAAKGMHHREWERCQLHKVAEKQAKERGAKGVAGDGYFARPGLLGTLAQVSTAGEFDQIALAMVRQVLVQEEHDHRSPRIHHARMDDLASRCGIDVAAEWRKAHDSQRPEIDEFFSLHTQDQLIALGKELRVPLEKVAGKAGKVTALLAAEDVPLPKCIKELEAAGKKAKKGGK